MGEGVTASMKAAAFVLDGGGDIARQRTAYGAADGFVYFIGIGSPGITHVKVGYTKGDPAKRMDGLKTGCPFPMRLLGFVFGCLSREREMHDVMKEDRVGGEWFAYSDHVRHIVDYTLNDEVW